MTGQVKPRAPKGQRLQQILEYIKQEVVGNEMRFTMRHAEQVEERFGITSAHIYHTIDVLAKRGEFSKRRIKGETGLILDFNLKSHKENVLAGSSKTGRDLTVGELIQQFETGIKNHEIQIARLKESLAYLYAAIGEKK